jgi:hypothetical protein
LTSITLDDILHKKAKRVMLFTDEIIKGAEIQVHISKGKWAKTRGLTRLWWGQP